MPELPKILKRWSPESARLFKVSAASIEFSNGEVREYEYLRSGGNGAVIIVPMVSDTEFLLVSEYGIGLERYEWGLPKGKVDDGESFAEAADRELKEEAGFGARRTTLLKNLSQSPNYMQHRTQIVLAEELYPETLEGDEPEPLGVEKFSFDDLPSLVAREDFTEARTIAALFLAQQFIASR